MKYKAEDFSAQSWIVLFNSVEKTLDLPKTASCSNLVGMNIQNAGIVMAILAALMILMGLGMVSIPNINPPIVSGVGFLVIAYVFYTHKH